MGDGGTRGEGREPSGELWCSETMAAIAPRSSLHATMSMAALYRAERAAASSCGVRPSLGQRIENRSWYIRIGPSSWFEFYLLLEPTRNRIAFRPASPAASSPMSTEG